MVILLADSALVLLADVSEPGLIGKHQPCGGDIVRINSGYSCWTLLCDNCLYKLDIPNVVTSDTWVDIFLRSDHFLTSWAFQRLDTTMAEKEFVVEASRKQEPKTILDLYLQAREHVRETFGI